MQQPEKFGRYAVIEKVGRGGMGHVYRGHDALLEREVAIKVLSGDFTADETARTRFFREARAAARLQHRNIVTIFEFGEEDATPYIVMEFLRGHDLARRMRIEPPLALEQKLEIMAELCAGLHFAHEQGVIHRDVKPANIWLLPDGAVKLLDFGIAKIASSTVTRQGSVFGSASYMAPEQVAGGTVDARSDIFSVGVVLYELLSGRKPFEADSPTAVLVKIMEADPEPLDRIVPDLPKPVVAVVTRALQKEPDRRYLRAADLGADLRMIRTSLQAGGPMPVVDLGESAFTGHPTADLSGDRLGSASLKPASTTGQVDAVNLTLLREPHAIAASSTATRLWWPLGVAAGMIGVGAFVFLSFRAPAARQDSSTTASGPTSDLAAAGGSTDAAPVTGSVLRIVSDPAGAGIIVDGVDSGKTTPAEITVGKTVPSEVRLTRKGLPPFSVPVTTADLTRGEIVVTLPKAPEPVILTSVMTVTGAYPFEILEGDRVLSPASEQHQVSVTGRRTLRLRAGEVFLDRQLPVEATGKPLAFQAPGLGRLTVRTPFETCGLVLDGRELGFPPIVNVTVVAGNHRVEQRCPDGTVRQATFAIRPGEPHTEYIR